VVKSVDFADKMISKQTNLVALDGMGIISDEWEYRIKAINTGGESTPSNTVTAVL